MKCPGWPAVVAGLLVLGLTSALHGQTRLLLPSPYLADAFTVRGQSCVDAARTCEWDGGSCDTEPARIFQPLGCRWTLTGWIDAGVSFNTDAPPSRFNGPVNFNDRNDFQMNQLYASLERKLEIPEGDWGCFDWGGRFDMLWGTDYIFTQAAGLETRPDNFYLTNNSPHWNQNRFYGLALPQFYAEAGIGDFSAKFGHFYSPIGYEMVPANGNFFYSHAYTHRFGEPLTHTGAIGTFRWYENLALVGGVVNGWDGFDRRVDGFGGLGGITYSSNCGRWSISGFAMSSEEPNATATTSALTMYSLIFTYNVTDDLQWVVQHDCGWQDNAQANGQTAEWYSLVNYVYYKMNDCWTAGLRAEWFRDDDGVRVNGVRPGNPNQAPFIGNFYDITAGLNWTPTANFRLRPELRVDGFGGNGLPFDDGNSTTQLTAALDAIILW